jgi:hypothetical protein
MDERGLLLPVVPDVLHIVVIFHDLDELVSEAPRSIKDNHFLVDFECFIE